MTPFRIAITGAAGAIGYSLVYRIAAGDLLGERPVELRLLEIPAALPAVRGVQMELADCAFPNLTGVVATDDPEVAFEGANLALLVGAKPRTAGMERGDLLAANGAIFATQGAAIAKVAAPDVRVVVTGNPANTNALIASRHAPGLPAERFTALTRLDENRARAMIAKHVGQPVEDVTNVGIWGNHSVTQYADAYNARICGRPATEWIDDAWIAFDFLPGVAHRGAAVIAARKSSSAASAANATIEHARDLLLGTDWASMAVPSDGSYGVPEGLVSSFPCRCKDGDYEIIQGIPLSAFARTKIEVSVAELLAEAKAAGCEVSLR